jgi:hypothetical protein
MILALVGRMGQGLFLSHSGLCGQQGLSRFLELQPSGLGLEGCAIPNVEMEYK